MDVREVNPFLLSYHVQVQYAEEEDLEVSYILCDTMVDLQPRIQANSWIEPPVIFKLPSVTILPPVLKMACHLTFYCQEFLEGAICQFYKTLWLLDINIFSWSCSHYTAPPPSLSWCSDNQRDPRKMFKHFSDHQPALPEEASTSISTSTCSSAGTTEYSAQAKACLGAPGTAFSPSTSASQAKPPGLSKDEDQVFYLHNALCAS